MKDIIGRIHSTESFGAVDGPGVRFVVFLQGCLLRCLYCHNPDTWSCSDGKEISSVELLKQIYSYKNFIQKGGVTLSGGEPLLQSEFCEAIIDGCHESGFHVAIDTSGAVPLEHSKKAIQMADMLLLDIKEIDSDDCEVLTGMSNGNTIATLNYCEEIGRDVWIRHVLLPKYTLNKDKLHRLGAFLKPYKCIKKIEFLPYHKLGLYKWESLQIPSKILDIEPSSSDEVNKAKEIFMEFGLSM